MNLNCNPDIANHLKSAAQKVRVVSEAWFAGEGYCLKCSSNRLDATRPGTIARDYICPKCGQPYELKSSAKAHTTIVSDGGYEAMLRRIRNGEAPALMLMQYSPQWCVQRLVAIHPVFLTPAVIQKRAKPHIRPRTGVAYQMCDLNLSFIPVDGKISVVEDGEVTSPDEARRLFQESLRFADLPLAKRGWPALVLSAVRRLGKREFLTAELHAYESIMRDAYPNNHHIREKIRQQLQVLIALGYLERITRGEYRVIS